jgi:hypothetical protein
MTANEPDTDQNITWERKIKEGGADFVCFVDIADLPAESRGEYSRAVLFGKILSKDYINKLRAGETPRYICFSLGKG